MSHFLTAQHCPVLYKNKGETQDATPPSIPIPLPAGQTGRFIRSSDNRLWLFQRQWIPSARPVAATLIILHGTVDHSGAYHELAMELNKVGVAVVCTDMRGFGLSDGEAYYIHDLKELVSDVEEQYTRFHDEHQLQNVKNRFLLGKSIGGLIAAHAVYCPLSSSSLSRSSDGCNKTSMRDTLTGLIGLSGAFALDKSMIPSWPAQTLLYGLNLVAPKLPLKSLFGSSLLTSDEAQARKWELDPLVRREKLTVGYIHELLKGCEELEASMNKTNDNGDNDDDCHPTARRTTIPVLMLWGKDDVIVTLDGHELMFAKARNRGAVGAALKTYPGGRHNLLMEVPALQAQVMSDIRDWIVEIISCNGSSSKQEEATT